MIASESIDFRRSRSVGDVLRDSSSFIKQNFMAIMKIALPIAAIPVLLGSIILGFSMNSMFDIIPQMSEQGTGTDPSQQISELMSIYAYMIPGVLVILAGFQLFYLATISYIKAYVRDSETIEKSSIYIEVKKNFLKSFFWGIGILIIIYIGCLLCIFPGVYLSIPLSFLIIVGVIEESSFASAWKRSFFLIKDHWWSTVGLYFITYFIMIAISFIAILPTYIIIFGQMFSNIDENDPTAAMEAMSTGTWFIPLLYIFYLIPALIWTVITVMQYYNIAEDKDGTGLQSAIDTI